MKRLFIFLLLLFYIQSSLALTVDVNIADFNALQQVKGIGPKTAERILEERARAGNYLSLEELALRVKGIGQKTIIKLYNNGLRVDNQTLDKESSDAILYETDKNKKHKKTQNSSLKNQHGPFFVKPGKP